MPTPVYELQMYFKKPMEDLRKTRANAVLYTILPLCLLMFVTGRVAAIGALIFVGFLFLLPTLLNVPSIDVSEKGVSYKSLRGISFVGWNSIGSFVDYDSKNPDRIMAPVTGDNATSVPLGFQKIGGAKYLVLDLSSGQHLEAARRLNEFRDLVLSGGQAVGEQEGAS